MADLKINVPKLIDSRMLIQANSGGGKSWANRWLIEYAFGKVQVIVIDPEGEFSNMRQHYDFVYAGKGGDCPAESRSAALLATRLLELKASAIVDIYELPPQERKHFVKLFLDAMVNAPKELWHDCLIILDEAHIFAPEKDQAESLSAVIDMASRGRKRGFCLVPATQRPAKLNKDVAAECNNKLIGRASLDIDRKRSAEELGFNTKEEVLSLRNLEPGEFYAFGPAISREVIKIKIGDVKVKPPKRGQSRTTPPPPSAHVKQILGKLSDIPQEAAEEAKTVMDLKKELSTLQRHKCPSVSTYDPEKMRQEAEKLVMKAKTELEKSFDDELRRFKKQVGTIKELLKKIGTIFPSLMKVIDDIEEGKVSNIPIPTFKLPAPTMVKPQIAKNTVLNTAKAPSPLSTPDGGLPVGEKKILAAVAQYPNGASREQLTVLTGYKSSSRNTYLQRLSQRGYVNSAGSEIVPTQEGIDALGSDYKPLPEGEELRQYWLNELPEGEAKILSALIEHHPTPLERSVISELTGYKDSSRNTYLQRLSSRQLVIARGAEISLSEHLFN